MLSRITIILLLLSSHLLSYSQEINRFKNKERQGKWIIYYDSANTHIDNIGRYRRGIPKVTWKYYNVNGTLTKKKCTVSIK
jgi:antitoxin component YwqK of YwqJK toxin-antitoxin module